mgnify:CR=1 FL=1
MHHGGNDAHKECLTIAIVEKEGELFTAQNRVPVEDGEPLLVALEAPRPLEAVVETCPFWPWIHDVIEPTEIGFHLAHANRLQAIVKAETKTDSMDARLLARTLAAGLVPEVYAKPRPSGSCAGRLVRHRKTLVEERTSLLNRIHSHLLQQGLQIGKDRLSTGEGRRWLREEAWPWLSEEQRALVEGHRELIDQLNEQIDELDGRIRQETREHPAAELLQTIPGIGPYRSLLLVAEITPIERFPSPDHLVSFAGLAPSVSQSGVKDARFGPIPEGANRWIRGVLVSTIPTHMQTKTTPDSSLGSFYQR